VKKLINIVVVFVMLVMTVTSQSPVVNQISQFVVGPISAHDIKFWGDDFIASRTGYESGSSLPYREELILLNKFGEVIWTREFPPAGAIQSTQIAIKNLFCIFTIGDSVYKISKAGEIVKKISVPTQNLSLGTQNQEVGVIFTEGNSSSASSKFFVYSENLDLVSVIAGQPGSTYSVSRLRDSYFVSGMKYGGGVVTNVSSHVARYDTTGSIVWIKQFPDIVRIRLVISNEKLYFCGPDFSYPYKKMIYGELSIESGDTLWTRSWGAPYPETFATIMSCSQMYPSSDGGFIIVGSTTYPGQQLPNYEPNLSAGLILGYSPGLDYSWVKTTSDAGDLLSGDWKDSSLVVFGNLGQFPTVAKAIIYSVSGLTAIEDDELGINSLSLGQNYPNPFNPSTKIKFLLIEVGLASLRVYDLLGREVATLVNEELLAGEHEVSFEASALASGMYIYTLSVGRHAESKKMVLLR